MMPGLIVNRIVSTSWRRAWRAVSASSSLAIRPLRLSPFATDGFHKRIALEKPRATTQRDQVGPVSGPDTMQVSMIDVVIRETVCVRTVEQNLSHLR